MPRFSAMHFLLSLATLSAPLVLAQHAVSARPGTLNYIEGQASLEGQQLSSKSVGHTEVGAGQYLATATGKAEVLLTPGVFLRLDNNTTVKMVTPDLTHTEVQVTQGHASVEVDQLYKQNNILVDLKNGQTQLLKNGLYEFDATADTVRVFNGEVAAFTSLTPQPNEKAIKVKEGKQLTLTGEAVKPAGFDRKQAETADQLYSWSSLRSSYLGEANLNLASGYASEPGFGGGFAPGWFWSQSLYSYTWLPGDGLFWNPFGYGFYSPYYLYGGGFIYGGYRGGYGYRGVYRGGTAVRSAYAGNAVRASSTSSSGFHSSMAGGGGFHGGGGGGHR